MALAFAGRLGERLRRRAGRPARTALRRSRRCARASPISRSTLSAAETQALEAKLAAGSSETGNQLAVLIVPTTQPEPIEAYSIRVAEAWKIGRKGQDNGALFLVAKNDRKLRIEVGYGLEGVLTDVTSRRIIAENDRAAVPPEPVRARASTPASTGSSPSSTRASRWPRSPRRSRSRAARGGFDFETLLIVLFVVVPVLGGILRADLRQGPRLDGRRRHRRRRRRGSSAARC